MLSQLLTKSIRSYLLHEGLFNTQGIDRQMADGRWVDDGTFITPVQAEKEADKKGNLLLGTACQ